MIPSTFRQISRHLPVALFFFDRGRRKYLCVLDFPPLKYQQLVEKESGKKIFPRPY
jgi:hypothetical protein